MKYRIVTNGDWYEIEYRPWWWSFWVRHSPSRHRIEIDCSKYRFKTVQQALKRIHELKKAHNNSKFEPVDIDADEMLEKYDFDNPPIKRPL